jgi:sugar phosphate isomerase/epimerase
MKLSTQDKPFFPENIESKLSCIKEMGFDAYEIDGAMLVNRLDEVARAVNKTGVSVSSVCGGYKGWIGDFDTEKRAQAINDISNILQCASKIGAKGIVVPAAWGMFSLRLPPMIPPRSAEQDRTVLLDSLYLLNQVAEATDTFVFLEPLNRYEDHMINTLETGKSLIEEGKFSNVKLTADFFHMNIEEKNIRGSIINYREHIGHIHLADSHRYQPGDGHMDFVSGFAALKSIGFDGYMAFECRVQGDNPADEYKKSVQFIKSCIESARGSI